MGLSNGKKLHAILSSTSISAVKSIVRNYCHVFDGIGIDDPRNQQCISDRRVLAVAIDMNWIAHAKSKTVAPDKLVEACMDVLITFAKCGFEVYPVFDPPDDNTNRHHSKRATIYRRAKIEKNNIDIVSSRYQLNQLTQEIIQKKQLGESTNELEEKKKNVASIAKKKEITKLLPHNFIEESQSFIERTRLNVPNSNDGVVKNVIVGKFQADPTVAKLVLNGTCHILVCDDFDYGMYMGKKMCAIKNFDFNKETREFCGGITMTFTSNEIAQRAYDIALRVEDGMEPSCSFATYEFFNTKNFRKRAIIAFILGCDVYQKGIPGVGPAAIHGWLQKCSSLSQDCLNDKLNEFCAGKLNTNTDMIESYIEALLYEPANAFNDNEFEYIGHAPTQLREYCMAFRGTE